MRQLAQLSLHLTILHYTTCICCEAVHYIHKSEQLWLNSQAEYQSWQPPYLTYCTVHVKLQVYTRHWTLRVQCWSAGAVGNGQLNLSIPVGWQRPLFCACHSLSPQVTACSWFCPPHNWGRQFPTIHSPNSITTLQNVFTSYGIFWQHCEKIT